MSDFSFKNNKQIEIIKEMVKTSSDRYEINGIELSKARFMWRKLQEAFQILSPGSYSIIQEAGNTFLKIDDTALLGEAIEFQVIYVFDQESSQYIDDFPDVSILKEKYNELQRDFTNLNRLLKSNNITGDTLKMFYVLPELNEGEVWIRTKDGWKGTNVADLDKIVQDLINKIENEIKPDLTIWIKNELAKIQNKIDELMVHDYIDIPFLNKDVVQIYIDTDTKTVRECDNTKFEPLSAVGLKFVKEDGTTVTRCYFRGVYDKPATLNIQDGVYWQTHTSVDGLTLIQPQKWKSQAFELSNGKMYFDRGNPILLQGELGTIVFKEYETLNQAKADSSLVSGDYVIVTGDTQTNDGGQGVYQLVNGIFELRDFNRSFLGQKLDKQDTIEDLKKSTQYVVGDVVEVLGYYAKGDGSHHKRIAKSADDGSGEQGQNGIWWCIVGSDSTVFGKKEKGLVNLDWSSVIREKNNPLITINNKVKADTVDEFTHTANGVHVRNTFLGSGNNSNPIKGSKNCIVSEGVVEGEGFVGDLVGITSFLNSNTLLGENNIMTGFWSYPQTPFVPQSVIDNSTFKNWTTVGMEINIDIPTKDSGFLPYFYGKNISCGLLNFNFQKPNDDVKDWSFGTAFTGNHKTEIGESLDVDDYNGFKTAIWMDYIKNRGIAFGDYAKNGSILIDFPKSYNHMAQRPDYSIHLGDTKINVGQYFGSDFKNDDIWSNGNRIYFKKNDKIYTQLGFFGQVVDLPTAVSNKCLVTEIDGVEYQILCKTLDFSIRYLDTPYYTLKMQQEGIYEDYVAYRDELHEYENSQTTDEAMLLPVLQEPAIPESVKQFAEKYKLI